MNVRKEIVDALRRELVGPSPGLPFIQLTKEEVLPPEDPPRLRYGAGILFPSNAKILTQENDINAVAEDSNLQIGEEKNPNIEEQLISSSGESDPRSDSRGDSQVENDVSQNENLCRLPLSSSYNMRSSPIIVVDVFQISNNLPKSPESNLSSLPWRKP